jgi:hypothetical protein
MLQESVNYAIKVGADQRIITSSYNQLPKTQRSLYLLTTLDDEGFFLGSGMR